MDTGFAVDILYYRLHLTTENSVNLDTRRSQSFIWKYVKTKEPPYTERYVRWCGRSVDKIIIYLLPDFGGEKDTRDKNITNVYKILIYFELTKT